MKMSSLEQAIFKAKDFLSKMKGFDVEFQGRKIIYFLNFNVDYINQETNVFKIYCSLQNGLFSEEIIKFKINVFKDTGVITDVQKISAN